MDQQHALSLLQAVASGECSAQEALEVLRLGPFKETIQHEGLHLDAHRQLRTGHGEVVFAPGKSVPHVVQAMRDLSADGEAALATRVSPEQGAALQEALPDGEWWEEARLFARNAPCILQEKASFNAAPPLVVAAAGTSDMPVALEALGSARFFGLKPFLVADVGVAGLHRLSSHLSVLLNAKLLIVVAGMEGALASVLGGLTGQPILAVPTSVGYGASFGGLAALLAMLNSCATGVAVMNIDNGFGAAAMAAKLLRE